jgi:hypothetical protein
VAFLNALAACAALTGIAHVAPAASAMGISGGGGRISHGAAFGIPLR